MRILKGLIILQKKPMTKQQMFLRQSSRREMKKYKNRQTSRLAIFWNSCRQKSTAITTRLRLPNIRMASGLAILTMVPTSLPLSIFPLKIKVPYPTTTYLTTQHLLWLLQNSLLSLLHRLNKDMIFPILSVAMAYWKSCPMGMGFFVPATITTYLHPMMFTSLQIRSNNMV